MTLKNILNALAMAMCGAAANSAEVWVRCDQCTYSQAQALAAAAGPGYKVMVHSALTGSGYAFHTQATNVGDECYANRTGENDGKAATVVRSNSCQTATAESVALNTKQIEYAALVKEVYDHSRGRMKAMLRVNGRDIPKLPSGGPVTSNPEVTAYDVQNNLLKRRDTEDAIYDFWKSQAHPFSKFDRFVESMVDVQFFGTETETDIAVTLSDSSKVTFRIKSDDQNAEFVEAEDPNRIPVMNSGSQLLTYVGEPSFPNDRAAINWLENAAFSRVKVFYASSQIGRQVRCEWDRKILTCRQKVAD